jgi:PAS domain S-box-containing protein
MARCARVLLVDRSAEIRVEVGRALAAPGPEGDQHLFPAELISVAGAAEALSAWRERGPFDVALIDHDLVVASDFVSTLKRWQPDAEVILLIAAGAPPGTNHPLAPLVFDLLAKPLDGAQNLRLKVRRAAEHRRLNVAQGALSRKLDESEARYRTLMENSPDAIVVYDEANGRVQEANRAAQELYGYSSAELAALEHSALLAPTEGGGAEDPEGPGRLMRRADLHRSGRTIPVEVATTRVRLRGRDVAVETVRDVSARQRLEEDLRQACKLEAIGRLAGGVAHDFNNLLVPILNYGDFIRHRLEEFRSFCPEARWAELDEILAFVHDMYEAGMSAAQLSRQLLSVSRKQVVSPEVISLAEAVRRVERLISRIASDDVVVATRVGEDVQPIKMDRGQLDQLLMNLCVNACDAMREGGALTLSVENAAISPEIAAALGLYRSGRYVRLEVEDTGSGISPTHLEQIFEPFFTTKERSSGTGLGLAIAAQIVEQAGGKIDVASEMGRGTTFTIHFPAAEGVPLPRGWREQRPSNTPANGERILVVEDDDGVRRLVYRVLRRAGYRVIEARDGQQALEEFLPHVKEIDLVLTDVRMPLVKGDELALRLRAVHPTIPVVFMSGYAPETMVREMPGGDPVTILAKPFSNADLLSVVHEALSQPAR